MLRILHVVPVLAYGGIEKVIENYYDIIDHNKYMFDYVTHGKVEEYHERIINSGSRIYYLPTIGSIGIFNYIKKIKKSINISEYDYIHIHTGDLTGVYAFAYRKCGAKQIINHAHTAKAIGKKRKWIEWILRLAANIESDKRLACGKDAGVFCFGYNRFTILPNAINSVKFNNVSDEQKALIYKELNINKESFVIGHVGAMIDQKNQSFLIDIFYDVVKTEKNALLVLVGDGPDKEMVMQKIEKLGLKEKVRLCGIRNDVNVLMHIFDLFVFPSLFEGLPVVGIEAQTAGLYCLFSDQIDHSVDIGCGLSTFLSINNGTSIWVKEIEKRIRNRENNTSFDEIEDALRRSGFSIFETKKILEDTYSQNMKRENK